jgi:hypothetical protein
MNRDFADYLGKNPIKYAQELVKSLDIRTPPVDELEIADFLGYEIREIGEEDYARWPGIKSILNVATAHLFKQNNLIMVSAELRPEMKRVAIAHEYGHDQIPWHYLYNYACTAGVLTPTLHRLVEREAFICGSEILMPRYLFAPDAIDLPFGINAIKSLATRYRVSLESAAIQYVTTSHRMCALVIVEPYNNNYNGWFFTSNEPRNQMMFPFRNQPDFDWEPENISASNRGKLPDPPLRVKYSVGSPSFRGRTRKGQAFRSSSPIPTGTYIREGNPVFDAWNAGVSLHLELPASLFDVRTNEVYQAEILPLGKPDQVVILLSLPAQQLQLEARWESIE